MTLGNDFSGVIVSVGDGVTDFKNGDEVFGFLPYGPTNQRGAFAEKLIARTDWIAHKPAGVSHVTAASAATSVTTALQAIRDNGKFRPGGRVLISGVSGGVGSVAVQVALRLGASEVVAVGSGAGLDVARKFGATHVIDRKREDVFTAVSGKFEVIFDAAAAFYWSQWKNKLKPGGTFVSTLPSLRFAKDKLMSFVSSSNTTFVSVKAKTEDLKLIAEWLKSGLSIPLDATVTTGEIPQALARLKRGGVAGKIAVDVRF
jgi:NADPH:quinone reductase-like Zn-dependent oxidoreductase